MIEPKESEAQILANRLKDAAWEEVAHLPLGEAIAERMRLSEECIERFGLADRIRDPRIPDASDHGRKATA